MLKPLPKDTEHGPHAEYMIHLASCFVGPQSKAALDAQMESIQVRQRVGTSFGQHDVFGNSAIQGGARRTIAEMLSSDHSNITLTTNTNEGLHIIRQGLGLNEGSRVVMYGFEYCDVKTAFINRQEVADGCAVTFIEGRTDSRGRPLGFDLADFEWAIRQRHTDLVVVSHVQFPNGFVADLKNLSTICRNNGVPLVVDAAQSFGVLPLNPHEIGLSAVVSPLWKWIGGLRGNAFLWTAPEFRAQLDVGRLSASGLKIPSGEWIPDVERVPMTGDGRRFEPSTLPTEAWIPTKVALSEAAALGVDVIAPEVSRLHEVARGELSSSSRIKVYEPPSDTGATSFVAFGLIEPFAGRESDVVARVRNTEGGLPVDITARAGFIRVAPHYFTSDEKLVAACRAIIAAISEL